MKESRIANIIPYVLFVVALIYFVIVLYFTVFGRPLKPECHVSLEPFHSAIEFFRYEWTSRGITAFNELAINLFLLMPIGLFMTEISLRYRYQFHHHIRIRYCVLFITMLGFLCSLLIETLQYTQQRGVFSLDDLINNTFGVFFVSFFVSFMEKVKYWAAYKLRHRGVRI